MPGQIEMVPIDSLLPHPENYRLGDVEAIRESIRVNGFYGAVVVQASSRHIVAGNHRWEAAKLEGLTEIRAEILDVDDATAKRILAADNGTSDRASNDNRLLAELLADVRESHGTLEGSGHDDDRLAELLREVRASEPRNADPDDAPPLPDAEPVTKPGDLWELGTHRLLCGDATAWADLGRVLDEARADLVFTDPPYGVGYTGGAKRREALVGDHIGTDIYADSLRWLPQAAHDHAALYLWYADAHAAAAAAAAAAAGYVVVAQILWVKNHAQFMSSAHYHGKHEIAFYGHRRGRSAKWRGPNNEVTVWEMDRSPRNDFHPTQKPVALAERAIRNSTDPDDVVLDPFGGSGSTLIACEQTARQARLLEIDPGYCDVIAARWEQYTGETPLLNGEPRSLTDQTLHS